MTVVTRERVLAGIVAVACAFGAAALAAENVPVTSTDQLTSVMQQKASELEGSLQDLQTSIAAKTPMLDECVTKYKDQPTRDNFARVYIVHYSLAIDESRLLNQVCGGATRLAFCLEDDCHRKQAFGEQKRRQLTELQADLEKARAEYQALETRQKQVEPSEADKTNIERQKNSLKRDLEKKWLRKLELEKSIQRATAGVAKATQDMEVLRQLIGGVRTRRDDAIASLESSKEQLERARVLGPDRELTKTRESLSSMLELVGELRQSLKSRGLPEAADEAPAENAGALDAQIQAFLGGPAPSAAPPSANPEKGER